MHWGTLFLEDPQGSGIISPALVEKPWCANLLGWTHSPLGEIWISNEGMRSCLRNVALSGGFAAGTNWSVARRWPIISQQLEHGCRSLKIIGEGWHRISERWVHWWTCRQSKATCDFPLHRSVSYISMCWKSFFIKIQNNILTTLAVFCGHTWKPGNHPKLNINSKKKQLVNLNYFLCIINSLLNLELAER